ncbi:hypothetical protein C8R45DRAFT_1125651 [Mycena sanguinolenta]|nr:hypothetical protein C8R45DRAFT_1125651 [Mycena sanguinolenta]
MSVRQVPNELLLEIFRSLPRDTIKALSLACKQFREISRPFLFTHLHFHPYAVRNDVILLPPSIEAKRVLECLYFWTSDDIAPHVRSCKITPWQHQTTTPMWEKVGPVLSTWNLSVTDSPYILLAPFFEKLGKFTRLQSLHTEKIHFTRSAVASLCRARALTDLRLVWCSVTPGERMDTTSLRLGVSRFSFSGSYADQGIGRLLSLLRPERLRELELRCNPRIMGGNAPVFPSVQRLTTTVWLDDSDPTMPSDFLAILSKFPAVEIFSTDVSVIGIPPHFPALPSTALPVLRHYTGPSEMMALFLPRSTLTHLVIPQCNRHVLREKLNSIQASNILSLHVSFDGVFDTYTTRVVRSSLPSLQELHVHASCQVHYSDSDFHDQIAAAFVALGDPSVLPIGLERMAFRCAIKYTGEDKRAIAISVPEFNNLRDALVRGYPALTTFWLDGHNFLFHWRKSWDGVEEQGVATTRSDAQEMRQGFDDFWENHRTEVSSWV